MQVMRITKAMVAQKRPSLLSREQNLSYNATLATEIGDRQATLLQQIQYWLEINERSNNPGHYRDGRWWTYNTYEDWQKGNFPHWSITTIRRLVNDLEKRGLILSCQPYKSSGNQTKWYSIDYEAYAHMEAGIYDRLEAETLISSDVSKMNRRVSKMDSRMSKMDNSYIDPETTPETSSETNSPRTAFSKNAHAPGSAFSSKSAARMGEELFSNSGKEKPEDNCTSLTKTIGTDNQVANDGHIPNSQSQKPSAESSRKPDKPRRRNLFDGSQPLECDHNGWIQLPSVSASCPELRDRISKMKAKTMARMTAWLVQNYAESLGLDISEDDQGKFWISGLDFDDEPWEKFLGKDSPMPVRMMRDILVDRELIFQEEFNEQLEDFFWKDWDRFMEAA